MRKFSVFKVLKNKPHLLQAVPRWGFGSFYYGAGAALICLSIMGLGLIAYATLTGQLSEFQNYQNYAKLYTITSALGILSLLIAYGIWPLQFLRSSNEIFQKIALESDNFWAELKTK